MIINNLRKGMIIKNYKELCKLLKIEVKASANSKNAQLKELERCCKYHKEGQKFIIDEIYEEVKEKMDNRGGNNKVTYIEYIEKLILDLLVQNLNKEKVCLSKNKLFTELRMTNGNYAFCKRRIPKLSVFMGIDENTIDEFYESTDSTLKGNLERALDSLKKQSLILWTNEVSVCKIDVVTMDGLYNIDRKVSVDEYDEEIVTFKVNAGYTYNFRESTEEEKKFILHTEREVMKELNVQSKQKLVQLGLWDLFKKKVNDIVLKELNIDFYFDSYKILFNQDHIYEKYEELLDLLLTEKEREAHQQELNKAIIERLFGNTIKKQNRAIEESEHWFGEFYDETGKLHRRIGATYLNDNKKLIENLINKNSEEINKKVRAIKINKNSNDENLPF